MSENMNAQTILDAGAALTGPRLATNTVDENGVPFVVVPQNYAVHDLEKLLPQPTRKRGTVIMLDGASFIEHLKKHGEPGETVIYADVDYEASKYGLVAVINDHSDDTPQWRDHRATLEPIKSLEWKRWTGKNSVAMPQADFAAFIEDNMGDVASVDGMPTGKDMLEMALNFQANSEKRFKKKLDPQGGGAHLEYVDQADEATSTKMRFFERFTIGIPVFQGATDGYHVEARLKFRMTNGDLRFWYELVRPDRVFKTAVATEINKIKEAAGFTVLFGRPDAKDHRF